MPSPDPVAELAERAISIAGKAAATQAAIVKQQARSKKVTRWLAVSVALDVTLSIVTIFLAAGQISVSDSIRRTQVNGCALGNGYRTAQVRLWDHVISVSVPPPRETPAERARRLATVRAFRVYVHGVFRPVDCARLYRK